jgi:hypothetical protein
MDEATTHKGHPVKVVLPGIQVAKGFLGWLVTLLIPSHEDLLKAGVYLDERNDRLVFGGEELIYEKMRRNNDERSDLLPAERYSRSDGRVDEE